MELSLAPRPAPPIPPPPRAGRRQLAPSVLDVLLAPAAPLPSALDVDPAVLAASNALPPPVSAPPARKADLVPDDEEADRRVERARVLVTGGAVAALAVISAGALRLAL